jgi:hypothetical protein
VSVFDETVAGDSDFQGSQFGSVEELPMLERFELLVPAEVADRLGASEERVGRHIAPSDIPIPLDLAAMNPDSLAIHQFGKHRRPTAGALANSEDVNVFADESLAQSIEVQVWCDDVIVIEQEHVLRLHSVNGKIASYTDANIRRLGVDDLAACSGLRVFFSELSIGLPIVDHDDVWVVDVLQQ